MNEIEEPSHQSAIDVRQLARAIRFALVAIILGLSYISVHTSLSIGSFELVFQDMVEGQTLPALTIFVLDARVLFVCVSILVPALAIASLFLRRIIASFYIIGILGIITVGESIILYHGLSAPVTHIISAVSADPTK